MDNAIEPKTDRELLLNIHGSVQTLCKEVAEVKTALLNTTNKDTCIREHSRLDNKLLDHGLRIRKLENWKWYVMGGFFVLSFVIGLIFEYFKNS